MFLLGGACFLVIGLINERNRGRIPLAVQMLLSAFIITAAEFAVGYIVNIKLNMNVWDYSDLPYNFMGQICLLYTIFWFVLSLGCILADDWLRYWLFGEDRPNYRII